MRIGSRRSFLLKTSFVVGAALSGMSLSASAQQFKLTLADGYPPTEFINVNMQTWGEDIKKATNGAVLITMHHSGSLFKNPDIKRAVQTGQVEFGTQLMQNLGPEKRLFEIDGLPFLAPGYDQGMKLWEISRPYLASYMQKQGLRLLYAVPWPPQGFYFKKEVNSLADAKGLRQRAYNEMTSRLAQLMGTLPTTVQITELPQAMTTGTVQAFNTSPTSGVVFKVWEFSSHYYDTNAWLPKQMVFVNEQAFSKLPANFQKVIIDASATAEKRGWEMSRQQADEARKKLAESGLKVLKPSPTLQHELDKIGETMRAEWLQKADDDAKAVMTQYLKAMGK
jgi:TRAP-type C4-dicarboxylate transport system substrate-binding protein